MNKLRIISATFLLAAALDARAVAQDSGTANVKPAAPSSAGAGAGIDQSPPSNSDVLQETAKLVPQLRKSETRHYVILSDTSAEDISMIGSLLEAAFQKFAEVSETLDWNPKPLRHKLVAVVFRDQRDFNEFAMQNDKVNKSWAVGYYSPIADRLVFYKSDNGADVTKAMKQLDEQARRLQQTEKQQQGQGFALHTNQDINHLKHQINAEQNRIKDQAAGSFVSTAVHEAAHQLLFHTDVQRRGAAYPLWLAEGLATNFETERTDVKYGFQYDNWRRRDAFKTALDKDSIVPFEVLLTQDRLTDGTESAEAISNFYAQAYVLTNWMLRERPTEVRLYLESLRDGSFANVKDRKAKFEAIFGPIARTERNWIRYEGRRQKEVLASAYGKRVLASAKTDRIAPAPVPPPPGNAPAPDDSTPFASSPPDSRTPRSEGSAPVKPSAIQQK